LCGLISGYNEGTAAVGDFSPILMRRLSVRGFIVIDFAARWGEATSQLVRWVREGKLKHRETIVEGLENAPAAHPHGSLTPAETPLSDAENLFREPGPLQNVPL
jgi:NADPH-dependent curcumin reductase CurA